MLFFLVDPKALSRHYKCICLIEGNQMLFRHGRIRRVTSSALSSNYVKSRHAQVLVVIITLAIIGVATAVVVAAFGREG